MSTHSFDALIKLLGQEREIYGELADLLDQERDALLAMRTARLGEIVSRKETLALRLKALDESRRVLARRLAGTFGLDPDQLSLSDLSRHAPPPHDRRLSAAGRALRETVLRCKSINEHNSRAARRGLELVGTAVKHMIDTGDPAGKVYESPRKRGKAHASGASAFISRQV